MAIHAQLRLFVTVEGDVAGLALGFDVRVARNNLARHYQRFQLGLRNVETERAKH